MSAEKRAKKVSYRSGGLRRSLPGFYSLLLLVGLGVTALAHGFAAAALPLLEAEVLGEPLNGLFAVCYAWILAGLTVCILLLAWLRLRPVGVALTAGAAILWFLGVWRHRWSPSILLYVLPLAGGIALMRVGIRFASDQVLPVFDRAQASRAFETLQRRLWTAGRPGHILGATHSDAALAPMSPRQQSDRQIDQPSFVLSGCDQAIVVSDKLRIKGVRDPGLSFIGPDERIVQVIDLRPQVRALSLTGRTQDGIQVRVRASVAFQIDAGRRKPKLGESMPFSRAAAFKAMHAQRVEHGSKERPEEPLTPRLWDDLPPIKGEHLLRDIISKLDFDDLYGPYEIEGEPPRRKVARSLERRLRAVLRPIGIQLLSVDLGNFEPVDPQVYVRRARNWQTDWIRRITLTQAEGQVERLQILERARADARAELIMDLGRQLERMADAQADLEPDFVLDQFLAVLESLMTRPQLNKVLPKRTKDVLSGMRESVGE